MGTVRLRGQSIKTKAIVLTDNRHNAGANVAFLDGHAKWHSKGNPPRGCTATNYHVIPQ